MYIASLAFKRLNAPEGKEWYRFGALWFDEAEHRASILLSGFRAGNFIARPYKDAPRPYISGDIAVWTGGFNSVNNSKRYMNVGYICSTDNEHGVTYSGELFIDPTPCVLRREIGTHDETTGTGIFCQIFLDDREMEIKK